MANAVVHKTEQEASTSKILGIVFIVVSTLVCYLIGCVISQTDYFYEKTDINLNLRVYGVKYFIQMISMAVPLIFYILVFNGVRDTPETKKSFIPTTGSLPYIYDGWTLKAVIAGVVTIVTAFIIYLIAFKGTMVLIKPLLIWVWLAQGIFSALTFFIQPFKPLKKK